MLDPDDQAIVEWQSAQQPLLLVIVDTEAEFDWSKGGSRQALGVASVKAQALARRIFCKYRIRPTYVVDYPVASRPEGYEAIREMHAAGDCEIGAHLQPWDTPPLTEELSDRNSYPGNLPAEIERAKLQQLTQTIERNIGVRPRIYKAGRYGVGRATPQLLCDLGYEVDVSVQPGTDLSPQFGPDFTRCGAAPYWFGPGASLLEVPMTIGFTGLLARFGVGLYRAISQPLPLRSHVPGLLARLGLLDRITLTPEGVPFTEHRWLTKAMLARGYRVFSLTYHSPSLAPGNTPYVRTPADLEAFLARIEDYIAFFIGEVGGRATTPLEVKALAEAGRVLPERRNRAEPPLASTGPP